MLVHEHPDYVCVRLNRPGSYNALDTATLEVLRRELRRHRDQARPLLLRGGSTTFSIGSDLRELAAMAGHQAEQYSLLCQEVIGLLEAWPGMSIGVLNGLVIGAALELALGCDLLCALPGTRIGMPGLAWALLPVMGGVRRLGTRCTPDLAQRIFLGGDILDRDQALEKHLIHRGIASEDELGTLIGEAREWGLSAVLAIRDLRLRQYGQSDARQQAGIFAYGFYSGECQRRIHELID